MGLFIHFFIIFGTNLLTGGPAQIAVFCLCRKRISNGVQTAWNLRERDFWNKRDPEDLKWTSRNEQGGHEAGGAPTPLGAPSTLVGPSWLHRPTSSSYMYLRTPNQRGAPRKPNSTAATFCTSEIPSWGLFPALRRRGHWSRRASTSDDVWVVYLRPSGP